MKLLNQSNRRGDLSILISVVAVSVFGLVMVYSASYYQAEITYGDKFFYFKKQLIGLVLGVFAMIITAKIDYKAVNKLNHSKET